MTLRGRRASGFLCARWRRAARIRWFMSTARRLGAPGPAPSCRLSRCVCACACACACACLRACPRGCQSKWARLLHVVLAFVRARVAEHDFPSMHAGRCLARQLVAYRQCPGRVLWRRQSHSLERRPRWPVEADRIHPRSVTSTHAETRLLWSKQHAVWPSRAST